MLNTFVNRFNTVKQIPIFARLNWYDLQRIARKSQLVEFSKGDVVCQEGTPPDYFYCLVSGRLRTFTTDSHGRMDNVEFIHRGVHFGIISLLTGENHTLTYEAVNNSVVLKIDQEQFQQILLSIPALSLELNQSLSKRVRSAVSGIKTIFESTIISVYSPVRSTGSSTYAINLAMSLKQETGKKIVFISMVTNHFKDPVEPALPMMPLWKVPPVAMGPLTLDGTRVTAAITRDECGIDLMHVSFDPNGSALKSDVGHMLSSLVGDYHYVVIDLPNAMDSAVLETLTQSDLVHLITTDQEKD
ncbi:MAG: cyclic nucleotide-binding domain-containing protein, partial [Candidatus Omnitrophica bacterium]|nr:cyclic nucleotide-binding domain-containing protein [Candidatus Omnitrophota bacterium]